MIRCQVWPPVVGKPQGDECQEHLPLPLWPPTSGATKGVPILGTLSFPANPQGQVPVNLM